MLVDNDEVLPVKNLTALEESKIEFAKHIDILKEIVKTTEWNVGLYRNNTVALFDVATSLDDALSDFNELVDAK